MAEERTFSVQWTVESRGRRLIISVSDKPTPHAHAGLSDQKNVERIENNELVNRV